MSIVRLLLLNIVLLFLVNCKAEVKKEETIQVAFMADVHLQNVYGEFSDSDYKGVENPRNGEFATIRTMASQLHSTRLFNENYFAFLAALNDIANKGIKLVALPGDFSDDGQALNVRGLKGILDTYTEKYGIQFFITTGNHDPVRPFLQNGGKKDFLGSDGKRQPIFSSQGMYTSNELEHPVVISSDVAEMGYDGITAILDEYGFYPKPEYIYWETPFSTYNYEEYDFTIAKKEATFNKRFYDIPPVQFSVPDASYLVEPLHGLWFLAIDANVYVPINNPGSYTKNPENYSSASIGYNNVLTHKKHLINWVEKVANRAEKLDKKLVVFSHYPMVDFHNDASPDIQGLLGNGKLQTHRVPTEEVARVFADAGVKIHFAGHLHVNDTGVRKTAKGNTLVNVQIPSLAAYIPAYKLLTIHTNNNFEIETIVVDTVPRFDEFFDLYQQEYDFLKKTEKGNIWNEEVLTSKTYLEFTEWHIKELVRLRFIPSDWSLPFGNTIRQLSGKELLVLSQLSEKMEMENKKNIVPLGDIKTAPWEKAITKAKMAAESANIPFADFEKWNGETMLIDFYKLRSADELAFQNIGKDRLEQYQLIISLFLEERKDLSDNTFYNNMKEFSIILDKFMNGHPSYHFMVDMEKMRLIDLNQHQ